MSKNDKSGEVSASDIFAFFNEIGIINQLSSTLLARTLPQGVHPSHFGIVNHLYRLGDGKTPISIASAMQVSKNTMTHSLRVLVDHGLVTVVPNPGDARGKLVFLTPEGRRFREESIQRVTARFGHLFKPEHVEAMLRIREDLSSIRRHLDDNR